MTTITFSSLPDCRPGDSMIIDNRVDAIISWRRGTVLTIVKPTGLRAVDATLIAFYNLRWHAWTALRGFAAALGRSPRFAK